MNSRFKFPRRVRIHGGECGAVARALHHAAQKEALMTHESPILSQADLGNVLESTSNERKQMSTKTSIKRIALVTVSALGFGLLSLAPAKAATDAFELAVAETIAAGAESGTQVAGALNFVRFDSNVVAAAANTSWTVKVSGASATISAETGVFAIAADKLSASTAAGDALGGDTITVSTPVAGTVTFDVYKNVTVPATGITTSTLEETLTVTVRATATANVYSADDSTVYGTSVPGAAATSVTDAALATSPVVVSKTYDGITEVFRVDTEQNDGNGDALTSGFKAVNALITGAGTLGVAANTPLASNINPAAAATNTIYVFADGRSGVGTLSISVNGVVVKTYTITFYGALASLKATAKNKVYGADVTAAVVAGAAAADTYGVLLQGLDANGTEVPLVAASVDVTSADTNEFESADDTGTLSDDTGKTGQLLVSVDVDTTNRVGGKPTVMTYTVGTISTTLSLTAGKNASAGGTQVATMTTDKASYLPGEKITITVTGKDSSGNALGDGAQALFTAAPTSNISLSALPVASPVLSGGVATYTTYAPFATGTVVISATANDAAATALTASFAVTGGAIEDAATAAADAAAEAIDAANAATDAANLAAEAADAATVAAEEARDAADAATAAVEELATQVATLMAALKAQITTLANTVAKIAKKVRA